MEAVGQEMDWLADARAWRQNMSKIREIDARSVLAQLLDTDDLRHPQVAGLRNGIVAAGGTDQAIVDAYWAGIADLDITSVWDPSQARRLLAHILETCQRTSHE